VFLVTHAFAAGMKQRGWGRIVCMSSSTFGSVVSGYVHYVTTKAGVIGFVRALAGELGPYGITANAIAPSITRTPGTLGRQPRAGIASMEDEFQLVAQSQAIKRVEVPEDLIGTVSYLTSDDAAFVTGQTINVNGGRIFG
jgi:NAD(P)-dependent dehydrogenase (short-subunit alcohol dehydrogenase family)